MFLTSPSLHIWVLSWQHCSCIDIIVLIRECIFEMNILVNELNELNKCMIIWFALGVVSESMAGCLSEESKEENTTVSMPAELYHKWDVHNNRLELCQSTKSFGIRLSTSTVLLYISIPIGLHYIYFQATRTFFTTSLPSRSKQILSSTLSLLLPPALLPPIKEGKQNRGSLQEQKANDI